MKQQLAALGVFCALLLGFTVPASAAEVPAVSAASAVLMDADSGRVLYAKEAHQPRSIASTTKLMTALVAAEYWKDLSQTVVIRPEWTGIEGTSLYLRPGERLTLETLLYGLLLHSGNDAAVALAELAAGDVETFVGWMNQRAEDLGMEHTHFVDPHGLSSEGHYASALDMARLGAACLKNPVVSRIVATKSIVLEGRQLTNHNKLLWRYEGCTGMKTGYTRQAGRTLVSSAQKHGQNLVCVTLNDREDWQDHAALLDYGFDSYPRQVLAERDAVMGQVPVEGSLLPLVPVQVRSELSYPVGEGEEVAWETDLPDRVQAPVQAGEIAGSVRVLVDGQTVGQEYLIWGTGAGLDAAGPQTHRWPWSWLSGRGKADASAEPND